MSNKIYFDLDDLRSVEESIADSGMVEHANIIAEAIKEIKRLRLKDYEASAKDFINSSLGLTS